ncbi:MAG: hypothetical protein ACREJY_06960 [Candidatus Rokuibacteriota bacterium]
MGPHTPRTSRTLGTFTAPSSLPLAEFDTVNERVSQRRSGSKDIWHGFASAWNGVAYRMRAALDHEEGFAKSVTNSSAPPPDERYRQDHDLFGFVVSAVSAIECFHFAAHCVGSLLNPTVFPLSTPSNLKFYPTTVRDRSQSAFPGDALTEVMSARLTDLQYGHLNDLRNVLAHRGTPPRMTFLSTTGPDRPSAIPSNLADLASGWRYDLHLSPQCLSPFKGWLENSLHQLVTSASVFVSARL